jgi:pantoate--beta-alanine ligase
VRRISTIDQLRSARAALSGSVAFVPTMGFLHDGHLELMRHGLERCDHLVVSVFVNPTQFGEGEDLDDYPRDIDGDAEKCRQLGCDLFFTPPGEAIYPAGNVTRVVVDELDDYMCGPSRPVHFPGVTNVVSRLFNLVAPDVAVFGEKDYQQLAIIRRMVKDLHFPIEIAGVPTVREADGLAMSSRNRYLDDDERAQAICLSRGLLAAFDAYQRDSTLPVGRLLSAARAQIEARHLAKIDYIECVHPDRLTPLADDGPVGDDGAVMAMAVTIGRARLIDNLRLDRPLPDGPLRRI